MYSPAYIEDILKKLKAEWVFKVELDGSIVKGYILLESLTSKDAFRFPAHVKFRARKRSHQETIRQTCAVKNSSLSEDGVVQLPSSIYYSSNIASEVIESLQPSAPYGAPNEAVKEATTESPKGTKGSNRKKNQSKGSGSSATSQLDHPRMYRSPVGEFNTKAIEFPWQE